MSGQSPHLYPELAAAIGRADCNAVRSLLDLGADIDAYGGQILVDAILRSEIEIVRILLDRGVDIHLGPIPAVSVAAGHHGANKILTLLLEHGADPNAPDYEDCTPIFYACDWNGTYEAAQALIDAGAEVNHINEDGESALTWAAFRNEWWHGLKSTGTALLSAGANPNHLNPEDSMSSTPLICAVHWGRVANVGTLLERGADPNLTDRHGVTPLMTAASAGYSQMAELLVKAGADTTAVDAHGRTAETYARLAADRLRRVCRRTRRPGGRRCRSYQR